MTILLLFATYSSGTQVVAEMITELLKKQSIDVTLKEVDQATPDDLTAHDVIILGTPSWDIGGQGGNPHEHFLTFFGKTFPDLSGKKFALFGLGDTAYPIFCGGVDHLEEFVKKVQGVLIVPSLRIDGYFFNPDEANKAVEEWVSHVVAGLKETTTPSNP